jgi:hypothetical protein
MGGCESAKLRMLPWSRRATAGALAIAWAAALCVGLRWMSSYEATPGAAVAADAVAHWPEAAGIAFAPYKYNLIVFLHPRCPCSRATVGELDRIMARAGDRIAARVLFVRPAGVNDDWAKTPLFHAAAAIPNVIAVVDADGAAAAHFTAATSGQCVLYAPDGRLVFAGGITAFRDHAGDNAGESAILAHVAGGAPDVRSTPVFGCDLFSPTSTITSSNGIPECRK